MLAAVAGLAIVAAAFRFWALDRVPPGFHYDEAFEALEAWRVLTQPGYHPIFFTGNFGVEPAFIYLTAAAFRLFGETPEVMRGVAAVAGTLTVLAVYGLGRELVRAGAPPATPLLAALALAVMRWHVTYSRVGIEPVLVPLLVVLMLWALWRGLRTNSPLAWAALGIASGLGSYTYPAGRLLPPLLAALVLYIWLVDRSRLLGRGRGLALAGLAIALVLAPYAAHFIQHPDQLVLRSSQIAVTPAGGGQAAGQGGLAGNLLAVLGMFSVAGDGDPRNNVPGLPVLDLAMSLPFYLGLAYALWRWRRPWMGALVLVFAAMLTPTIFSDYAPHFRRAVGAAPMVALFSGVGLALILGNRFSEKDDAEETPSPPTPLPKGEGSRTSALPTPLPKGERSRTSPPPDPLPKGERSRTSPPPDPLPKGEGSRTSPPPDPLPKGEGSRTSPLPSGEGQGEGGRSSARALRVALVAAILFASAAFTANAYFVRWGQSPDLYYAYDQGLWEIGDYLAGRPAGERLYISPRPATDMTLAFAWRDGPHVRHFDGRHAFVASAGVAEAKASVAAGATYVIIEHEDFRGSRLVKDLYPQAAEARVFYDRSGQVYARAYYVPPDPAGRPLAVARDPLQAGAGPGGRLAAWPGAELIGYDVKQGAFAPGEIIYLQLWWRTTGPITTDWTVFTHLLGPAHPGPDGSPTVFWAGQDSRPGAGSAAMPGWQPGDLVLDEYQIRIPADAPKGAYTLEAGLYDLAANGVRGIALQPAGADHAVLGQVEVK